MAVIEATGANCQSSWLEPAVGKGAFVNALETLGVPRERIRAIDIEKRTQPCDAKATTLRNTDFLCWAKSTSERFDRVVSNPPFVSLEVLSWRLQHNACCAPTPPGVRISAGGNYWHAFLCASVALLKPEGNLGFVLPAAWEYADYASQLRARLCQLFATIRVHRSREPLFERVQEGAIVLIARGYGREPVSTSHSIHRTAAELLRHLRVAAPRKVKAANGRLPGRIGRVSGIVRLGEIAQIGIGAVTGDVKYFLLSEDERRARRLPRSTLRPAVTKARHLVAGDMAQSNWSRLRDSGARIWLFNPSKRQAAQKNVRRYLRLSLKNGGCNRTAGKVHGRKPWYRVKIPRRCDAFISGTSRYGPWICMNKMRRLTATNTLFAVWFNTELTAAQRYAVAISLQTTAARRVLRLRGRRYADGLIKFEPRDILGVELVFPGSTKGARSTYLQVVRLLLRDKLRESRRLADQWIRERGSRSAAGEAPNNGRK